MILLIYPSIHPDNPNPDIDPDDDAYSEVKVVPFSVLYVGSLLAGKGHEVEILDCRFIPKNQIGKRIADAMERCDIIGFSVMTLQITHALALSAAIKANHPDKVILWGGTHVTLFPLQTLQDAHVDFVLFGEAGANLPALVGKIQKGETDFDVIQGIGYKVDGTALVTEIGPPPDVNELPQLDYDLLNMDYYIRRRLIDGRSVRGIDIITSKGCPHRCSFCVNSFVYARKWRPYHAQSVIDQVKRLVDKYKIEHVWFYDDFMFANRTRIMSIFSGILDEGIKISWETNIRANNFGPGKIDDEALALMVKSGCYMLYMGFESGSDRMLKFYKKDITVADIVQAVDYCSRFKVHVKGYFMMGAPGETYQEVLDTYRLIYKLKKMTPKFVPGAAGFYRPYAGGELYNYVRTNYNFAEPSSLAEWSNAYSTTGYLDPKSFPWMTDYEKLENLRFYGRMLAASTKNVFKKPLFFPVRIVMALAEFRFAHSFWWFPVEARTFFFVYKHLRKHYRLLNKLRIPINF